MRFPLVSVAVVAALAVTVRAAPEIEIPKPKNGVLAPGAADKIVAAGAKPIVRVLEAGGAPRSDLAYGLIKGSKRKMAMAMDMTMAIAVMGQNQTIAMPTMTLVFDLATVDKNAAGDFQIDAKVVDTSVDSSPGNEQIAKALRDQISKMKGMRMVYWIDPKGYIHDGKVDLPKDLPAQMAQMMTNMTQSMQSLSLPLPAEAVGAGAKWQGVTRISSSGADILQTATFTMKDRGAKSATLDVVLRQLAADATINSNGVSTKLKAFDSSGSGTVELDLASGMPKRGKLNMKMAMDIDAMGSAAHMDMTMGITVKTP